MEHCNINLLMCMNLDQRKQLPIKLPNFYQKAILAWHQCGGGLKAPQEPKEIRQEIIWGNKYIQSKGKTLFFKKTGLEAILCTLKTSSPKTGNSKKPEAIIQMLTNTTNWIAEYNTIINSIPRSWKEKLRHADMRTKVKTCLKPFINDNGLYKYNIPKTSKEYYKLLVKGTRKKSFIQKHWDKIFPNKPTWNNVWTKRVMLQKNKTLADFHFKLLHKILPSGENLFKWKMLNSSKCRFGCDTIETYEHMLVNCPKLQDTYSKITRMLKELHYEILFTYKLLIFGYKISYPAYDDINMMLSHIFYAVYKNWLENDDKKEPTYG